MGLIFTLAFTNVLGKDIDIYINFRYYSNPQPGIWGAPISNESGTIQFNGIIGDLAARKFDTSVAGMTPSLERNQIVDFPPVVTYSYSGAYVSRPSIGEFSMTAYTSEFKVATTQ